FAVASPGGNTSTWQNSAVVPPAGSSSGTTFGYPTGSLDPSVTSSLQNLQPGAGGQIDSHLRGDLEATYGKGFGRTLDNVLKAGAGYNPQVAESFINAIHPYFQSNLGNIMSQFGAAGQRFSSTAALAAGKAGADFTAQEQTFMAQMYQWAYGNYLSVLTSKADKNTKSDIFGTIGNILGLTGTAAGALTAGGVGA